MKITTFCRLNHLRIALFSVLICISFMTVNAQEPVTQTADGKIAALTAKIAASPKNDKLYVERGKAYIENGRYSLAEKDAETALKINPKNKAAQELRSRASDLQAAFEQSWMDSFYSSGNLPKNSQKKSADKPQPPKTEAEWKEICRPYFNKMYEALKKGDFEPAKKIYAEFDAETKGNNGSIRVKVERDSLLHNMYFSSIPQLKEFVENEMKRLKYTEKEKEEVKRDTSKGFYV